jgi:glycosyltransferase involved in cell wall biosynthesis
MRIAMIGQKGIPAVYGGIERHVEEISTVLASRGHTVFVYCRPYYTQIDGDYKGVHLIRLPSVKTRNLDCASHTAISTAHVLSMKPDIVHYHALGPSALSFVPRLTGARTVVTVHGLDWRGGKWGALATWILQRCEYSACHFPNRTIVVSKILKQYFKDRYGKDVAYVPNGVRVGEVRKPVNVSKFDLAEGDYYLFVGRLGAEKGCHILIDAFTKARTARKLVMVGSAHLNIAYEERLRALSNDRVVFTGAIYGDMLTELWNGAYAVIHPSMTEGMSLSLLEAMAHRRCVVVSDIPENLEVIGEGALTFKTGDAGDLSRVISEIDGDPEAASRYGARALARARESFDWQKIVDGLEKVYAGNQEHGATQDCG